MLIPNVFKNPNYLKLFMGMSISKLGNWFYFIALPLIVYELTGSASKMALVFVVEMSAHVLFTLIGGALADQISKKKIMVFGDFTSAIIVSILPILNLLGYLQLWIVYIVAFLLASITAFHHPSFESSVPEVVDKKDLIEGNSLFRLTETLITFMGPALAGVVIALIGTFNVLYLNSIAFILAAISLSFLVLPYSEKSTERPQIIKPIQEGLKYVMSNKIILSGALIIFGINIGYGAIESLFMFYLKEYLALNATQIGLVFGVQAIGPFIAVYLANKLKLIPRGNIVIFSGIIIGVFQILLILSQTFFYALIICQIFIKGSVTLLAINWFTLRQEIVPGKLLGRVVSSTRMIAFLAFPFSGLVAGFTAEYINVTTIFVISGVIVILCSLIGLKTSLYHKKVTHDEKEIRI